VITPSLNVIGNIYVTADYTLGVADRQPVAGTLDQPDGAGRELLHPSGDDRHGAVRGFGHGSSWVTTALASVNSSSL